ncbi:MAG: hypothetical protein HYT87_12950 [Nitrospirae bacterium]|nr:hypothetical protein [Nitrospirota bacterium]
MDKSDPARETLPEVITDTQGRTVASRIQTPFGEAWVTKDRGTALKAGLVGTDKKTQLPVYYISDDEALFVKDLSEAGRAKYHLFKTIFDSPAGAGDPQPLNTQSGPPKEPKK